MREQDEQLLAFCIEQQQHFDSAAWLSYPNQDQAKVAALLLSSVIWYQKSPKLNTLCKQCAWPTAQLTEIVKTTRFDCPRFISRLKKRLSLL
jgi:hypothetical protein